MLNLSPLWSGSLADQSSIRFSIWDYFWCCIAGKVDCTGVSVTGGLPMLISKAIYLSWRLFSVFIHLCIDIDGHLNVYILVQ